jgi:hypothetical protein
MNTKKRITSLQEHLTKQYGKPGTKKRDKFETKANAFLMKELTNPKGKVPK